ncbi:hypothetical protein GCM10010411_55660 [Actinomadura fulvescens]|uniref:Uncharacterized protein n=1 Tax=Actinomadura fulvescens TaxID=46160 RepID=A0ABP6CGN2_9ACTN
MQADLIIEQNATAKGDVNVVCVPDLQEKRARRDDHPVGIRHRPVRLRHREAQRVADRFSAGLKTAARTVPLAVAPIARPARTLFAIHPVDGGSTGTRRWPPRLAPAGTATAYRTTSPATTQQ